MHDSARHDAATHEAAKHEAANHDSGTPRWFQRVADLYAALDEELAPHVQLCELRGVCCDFRSAEHRLYATELEIRYALRLREQRGAPVPEAEDSGLCPFWRRGLCTAREERPLGCRTYFCAPSWRQQGEALHERYHQQLQRVATEEGIPYRYGPWVEGLAEGLGGGCGES